MRNIKPLFTINDYISGFPPEIQAKLNEIRAVIKKAAPDATEKISYGMPAFTLGRILLYIAAHRNHIGFYPLTSAIEAFNKELSDYTCSKGTIQLPYNEPVPLELIERITTFRVKENLAKAQLKSVKKVRKNSI